jgi:hypothetical protein
MLTIDQTTAEADAADSRPACVALVPVTEGPQRSSAVHQVSRPDPTFVTHLIATAEHLPQTRNLRRAAPSVALSAYTAHLRPAQGIGRQTRQVA